MKRCIAIPGDIFEICSNQVYINDKAVVNPDHLQHIYHIVTDGSALNDRFYDRLKVSKADRQGISPNYNIPLSKAKAKQVKEMPFIKSIQISESLPNGSGFQVFPHSRDYNWSRDNFGPLKIPQAGETVKLDMKNLVLYDRIISAYEGNKLEVKNNTIFINEKQADSYTFKMNYYFMLGDNRHMSADSRTWGFVPEDHIVGKPILVWLSYDEDKSFPANIRWDRFFKIVHD